MTKLQLDSTPASLAASLVVLVAGFGTDSLSVSTGSSLSFDGAASSSLKEVLVAIASKRPKTELLGASDAEQKQVSDWFDILNEYKAGAGRPFLERLNAHLLASSFLAPNSFQPTIVDYAVWAHVQSTLATLTSADAADFSNVLRWSRYIVASIPRTPATAAWVKVPLTSTDLPAALASRIVELDLAAAAKEDAKLRAAAPVAAVKADNKLAQPPTVPDKKAGAQTASADKKPAAGASATSSTTAAAPAKEKKEKPAKEAKPSAAASSTTAEVPQIYRADLRVGKILSVAPHPTEPAKMYVEQIDVGEATGPRTIVSGIAAHFKAEELVNKLVVVMANLKAGDIKGVVSSGLILVATGADDKKELCTPPAGAKVGERITFANVPSDKAPDAELAPKRLHEIKKGLKTGAGKTVQYAGSDFLTSAGPVTVASIADGVVA